MSYILEALKKAQAERQLGNAPTIHAAQPVPAPAPDAAANRKPLLLGLGAGALVVVAGAVFLWRAAPAPTAAPATQAAARPAAPVAAAPAASDTLAVSAPPAPAPVAAAPARPEPRPAPPRVAEARPAPAPAAMAPAVPVPAPAQVAKAVPVPPRVPAAPPASVDAAPEDSLPFLQQLPANIQSQVPRVAFGGYMYSANPADRLLLIDKALRHEGEEVAPGLVLEKLLPKAAVMNYRGYRYRVAY
jgi:general secretion pathway protein B